MLVLKLRRSTIVLAGALLFSIPAASMEVHVSTAGSNETADGSAEKPFRTITEALTRVIPQSGAPDQPVIILVEAGVYATDEKFPITVAPKASLAIIGPTAGTAALQGGNEEALLEVTVGPECPSVRVQRIEFRGGLSAVTVVGTNQAVFEAAIQENRFLGQRYQGLEVVAAAGGSTTAVITGNTVEGSPVYAIDLGTQRKGELLVQVEDNRVADPSPPPPVPVSGSTITRYGVSVFVDLESRLSGRIDRNSIFDFPVGMLIFTESFEGVPAKMDLTIANCLIAGRPAAEHGRLRNGFYLGLRPVMKTDLRIVHSTVADASGFAVYQEEPADFAQAEEARVEVAGCIFAGPMQGVFSAETDGRALPAYFRVHDNLLPTDSTRTGDGNLPADPRLSEAYEPLPGSPAVDALDDAPEFGDSDLRGGCRVADGDGDGIYRIDAGAIERAGPCERDSRRFFRGDCDLNSELEITDPLKTLTYLFLGGIRPTCPDACDSNDDGTLDIADGVYTLSYLYAGGRQPPLPFPFLGADSTPDGLGECR
jgi:uncharacterized protein DUF1565